jgi:2Fe-2S ferredoxin
MQATEADMLSCATEPQDNSRLSCQLRMTAQTDALVVRLPRSQA